VKFWGHLNLRGMLFGGGRKKTIIKICEWRNFWQGCFSIRKLVWREKYSLFDFNQSQPTNFGQDAPGEGWVINHRMLSWQNKYKKKLFILKPIVYLYRKPIKNKSYEKSIYLFRTIRNDIFRNVGIIYLGHPRWQSNRNVLFVLYVFGTMFLNSIWGHQKLHQE